MKYRYSNANKDRRVFFCAYNKIKHRFKEEHIIELTYKPEYPNFEGILIYVETLEGDVYKSFSLSRRHKS